MSEEYSSDHPEVIRAKAEAEERILKARAELHPAAQVVYAVFDKIPGFVESLGCMIIILVIILAIFAPIALERIFGG